MTNQSQDGSTAWGADPVQKDEHGWWWFSDETWSNLIGQYRSEEAARAGLKDYTRWLDSPDGLAASKDVPDLPPDYFND